MNYGFQSDLNPNIQTGQGVVRWERKKSQTWLLKAGIIHSTCPKRPKENNMVSERKM